MDTSTGKIYSEKEANKQNASIRERLVGLNDNQYQSLSGMNRKARREYYRKHKSEFAGKSWSEVKNKI